MVGEARVLTVSDHDPGGAEQVVELFLRIDEDRLRHFGRLFGSRSR